MVLIRISESQLQVHAYTYIIQIHVHVQCTCNYRVDTHHKKSGRSRHADFTTRTLAALHDIVEVDWRREMEKGRECEELTCKDL